MKTKAIEITAEMIEAGEQAHRTRQLRSKRFDAWLAEVPLDEPLNVRKGIAYSLMKRAAWEDERASDHFHRVCPTPELRTLVLDMIERERS